MIKVVCQMIQSGPKNKTATSLAKLIFLLALTIAKPCSQAHCIDCDEKDYCEICEQGYYVQSILLNSTSGICLPCDPGCKECLTKGFCVDCFDGFTQNTASCPKCSSGCRTCENSETNCTSCQSNYSMTERNECEFKYTLHIIVGGVILSVLFVLSVKFCVDRMAGNRKTPTFVGSVLDDETRKNTYYVNHVVKIGQIDEDNEISKVVTAEELAGDQSTTAGGKKKKEDRNGEDFMTDQTAYVVLNTNMLLNEQNSGE